MNETNDSISVVGERKRSLPTTFGKAALAALLTAQLFTGSAAASVAAPGSVRARASMVRKLASEHISRSSIIDEQGTPAPHALTQLAQWVNLWPNWNNWHNWYNWGNWGNF